MAKPYVAPPEFMAYPNYLDLDDLIPGGTQAQQQAELFNSLLRASGLVDGYCRAKRGLDAHIATDVLSTRINPVTWEAAVRLKDGPLRQVLSIQIAPLGVPGATAVQVPATSAYLLDGMLRIPAPNAVPGHRGRVVVTVQYVAGWPVTTLAAPVAVGTEQLTPVSATGIMPGAVLRLWDPGVEEYVAVSALYQPGGVIVPLAAPLASAHPAGVALDDLPLDIHEAVTLWTMGLLARPTSGGDEDAFSDTTGDGPTTAGKDPRRHGSGLIAGAKRILEDGGYVRAAS